MVYKSFLMNTLINILEHSCRLSSENRGAEANLVPVSALIRNAQMRELPLLLGWRGLCPLRIRRKHSFLPLLSKSAHISSKSHENAAKCIKIAFFTKMNSGSKMKPSFVIFFHYCSYQDPGKHQLFNKVNMHSRWKIETSAEPRRRQAIRSGALSVIFRELLGDGRPADVYPRGKSASNQTQLHDLKKTP
jgi:hypothetical protein